jgi:pheromone shutdown protein TraB
LLYKVASQLEVLPGAEFRVAFEEAMSYGGKVILGDRPVQVSNLAMEFGCHLWNKHNQLLIWFFFVHLT